MLEQNRFVSLITPAEIWTIAVMQTQKRLFREKKKKNEMHVRAQFESQQVNRTNYIDHLRRCEGGRPPPCDRLLLSHHLVVFEVEIHGDLVAANARG